MDLSTERGHALDAAVALLHGVTDDVPLMLQGASQIYRWLTGPASVSLHYGEIEEQDPPHHPTGRTASAMTQIRNSQRFPIELTAKDAKGVAVLDDATTAEDNPTFVSSDENSFTYEVDPENPRRAYVVGAFQGSAVGTVTLGEIVVTHAVDVVPGRIALVELSEGEIEEQPGVEPDPEA